ncbi:uncharacterized protein [Centruroides vittatus]|uniref:uncharacterized protein n=1 Tax=Centruroides vittatus TaxID=120091 RepID=UPI00350F0859
MSIFRISVPKECLSLKVRFCLACLRKSIRIAKNRKYGLLREIINFENSIYNDDPEELIEINKGVVGLTDKIHKNLTRKYIKKMKWIIAKQAIRKNKKNLATFVVWDQVEVPDKIREVLEKGPNFVPENPRNWETLIQEIEREIVGLDSLEKDYFRWKTVIKNQERWKLGGLRNNDIRVTKRWLDVNDLLVTRADKTKHLVIMKRETYKKAIEDYIEKTECEKVNVNIIESIDRRVKKLEETKLSTVLPFIKKCRNPRPAIPRLFAFAKTHKEGKQIRPIVEKCRGPTFVLEKRLHKFISSQLESNALVAEDPGTVVKEIQHISLMEKEVGTVLDYESLYPSIRILSCKEALLELLFSRIPELLHYNNEVVELANLICYESIFSYDGQAYRQKRGIPMGSPISGILCELVVRKLEKRVLFDFRKDIVYFKRYVDDIFILWKNNRKINEFIEGINRNSDGLKLKLEQKSSVTIHFLDINIQFKNGHLSTSVYVKPTHSPLYIPSQSNDPYHYKMAAFRALIRRAFLYCDNVMDRAKEINRILQVAETLGYRKSAITGMVKRYEKNVARGSRQRPAKITKFTYNRYAKSIMKEIANRNETSIILKRAPNLYKILRNDKDSIRKEEKAGVYRIPYENAQLGIKKDYIGVTTRSLSVRLKEHKYNIRKSSTPRYYPKWLRPKAR